MEFFRSFLRQRIAALLFFLLSCAVFAATFALYKLPLRAVLYPTLICALLWLLFAAWDFSRALKKHRALARIAALSGAWEEALLPPEQSVDDADYREILRLLREAEAARESLAARRYADMVDYYTVWAHQIKTPIASMRLTLQGEDSPTARRLSADLSRIEQYVEMVLVFLRLDSDSTDYVIRACDLDAVVRGAVKKFSAEFIGRRLSLDYAPVSMTVLTDEKWLSFVIEQLLSNALKYTASGGISIFLEGETLCIRDTGIGIAPEDLPRVFEKGYTGLNGRADKRASGLGLWLCSRICARLGHTIAIDSAPGRGTIVRLGLGRTPLETE